MWWASSEPMKRESSSSRRRYWANRPGAVASAKLTDLDRCAAGSANSSLRASALVRAPRKGDPLAVGRKRGIVASDRLTGQALGLLRAIDVHQLDEPVKRDGQLLAVGRPT